MHDESASGNDFFKCDFCRSSWREDLPMIEGHQGSLICAKCLSVAYAQVVNQEAPTAPDGYSCALCLEQRKDPGWQSPACPEASVCKRCLKQGATRLEKDPDYGWTRPGA